MNHFFLLTELFGVNFKKKIVCYQVMARKLPSEKHHKKWNKEPARKIEIGHN
jgi:hypothetical protein